MLPSIQIDHAASLVPVQEHGMSPVHRQGERVNFLSSGMRLRWRNTGGGRG